MISTIRVIRIAQVYRMIRHLPDLQILVETMKASVAELKLWLCSFILISIIFATLIYYAEREHNHTSGISYLILFFRILDNPTNDFISIPDSIWWALVTMTTVGYGDMVPKTGLGMFVGGLCGIAGLLEKSVTIVSNYALQESSPSPSLSLSLSPPLRCTTRTDRCNHNHSPH